MKRKKLLLLLSTGALSLTGCSFFNLLSSDTSTPPWAGEKQVLDYTEKNLNSVHYSHTSFMPSTGKPKLLVLPIAFKDTSDFITNEERASISDKLKIACFGTKEETGWYSISNFYEAESYGKCVIEGEVADWYQSNAYYDNVKDTKETERLIQEATNQWKTNNPDKVKDYDSDGDGYIDAILAVYGGPNHNNVDKYEKKHRDNSNMWAYTSWLSTSGNVENPNPGVYVWASFDFMDVDLSGGLSVDTHTYIHEIGHTFGLDDYYDYGIKDQVWAGGFSMQDYNVGGHDPYSMMVLGWVDPYVPTESSNITIKPFESSGDVILLSPDFTNNSVFDEYILLELYTPTGVNEHDSEYRYQDQYPKGPTKAGIRIWHVDSRLLNITSSRGTERYTITSTIQNNNGTYIVGCTNTSYTTDEDTNAYCSLAPELRPYKLLQVIRNTDYDARLTKSPIDNRYLFTRGDTFSLNKYTGYFHNIIKFNNGKSFYWSVTVNSVSSSEASITVTYEK